MLRSRKDWYKEKEGNVEKPEGSVRKRRKGR